MNCTSSGMQYTQRMLQRSVTLIRKLLWSRPNESISLSIWVVIKISLSNRPCPRSLLIIADSRCSITERNESATLGC